MAASFTRFWDNPMHVMFVHPNFPAQFGHIAAHVATQLGWQATFVTSIDTTHLNLPFTHINYKVQPGPQPKIFRNPPNLAGLIEHMEAIYRGLSGVNNLRPDLVVGHMSYGTMLYLRTLYDCPFVGYYEYLPPPFWSAELALRPEYPPPDHTRHFNALYHTFTLQHLLACDAAYSPTHFQRSTAPSELQHKIRVIFDGVDTQLFSGRRSPRPVEFRGLSIGPETRVLTYVSRGLESIRGFDIFMQVADRLLREDPNLLVLVAGDERTNYGHDLHHIQTPTFKEHVLRSGSYDLDRIRFLGLIPPSDLAQLFALSDLHMYLTVPYTLSWSLVQAMAAGCVILGSSTPPVQEAIDHGAQGLLADFYDVESLTQLAQQSLRDPAGHAHLGQQARQRVLERYEKQICIGQLADFFAETASRSASSRSPVAIPQSLS
jgi:glycosyltransferase involved in cell wall biosynthesis